jgi:hypothetical protein
LITFQAITGWGLGVECLLHRLHASFYAWYFSLVLRTYLESEFCMGYAHAKSTFQTTFQTASKTQSTMELAQAIQVIDQISRRHRGRPLTHPEKIALTAAWWDQTYEEAVVDEEVAITYLSSRVAPELWQMLSDHFGRSLKKKNIRHFLEEHVLPEQWAGLGSGPEATDPSAAIPCFGREDDLNALIELTAIARCLQITGEAGIGKSSIANALGQAMQMQAMPFQVIRASICHQPSPTYIAQIILQELNPRWAAEASRGDQPHSVMDALFQALRYNRALILLDSAESWATAVENRRKNSSEQIVQEIEVFLRRVIEEQHKSCVLLISRVPIPIVTALEVKKYPCRSYHLEQLQEDAALQLLASYDLKDPDQWPFLIQRYRPNPLALIQAAQMIQNLFNGSVKEFIDLDTIIMFESFEKVFRSCDFSELELKILNLIGTQEGIKISKILTSINGSHSEIIATFEGLLRESLIERHNANEGYFYTIPPMLSKFLKQQQPGIKSVAL